MFVFGPGVLLGQRTDITNATPINFGLVQEVTTDVSFDTKELYGQYEFPVAVGRGKAKFTGKAKMARISGLALASLFFGVAPAAGQLLTSFGEAASIPAATPFTVTVANGATWVDDYGVIYAATGLPLTRVASAPTTAQYSVGAGGVYTFAAADTGLPVLISYTYTVTTATTQQIKVTNQLMGAAPTFQAQFYSSYEGIPLNVKFNKCTSTKLSMATKLDDFMVPEMDFDIFADAANDVMNISLGEVA